MSMRTGICPKCGQEKELTDHHPFPRNNYGNGKNNNPHSICLCDDCHRILDGTIVSNILRLAKREGRGSLVITPQFFVAIHVAFFGDLDRFVEIIESRIYTDALKKNKKRNKNNERGTVLPSLEEIIAEYKTTTLAKIFGFGYEQVTARLEEIAVGNYDFAKKRQTHVKLTKKRNKEIKRQYKKEIRPYRNARYKTA